MSAARPALLQTLTKDLKMVIVIDISMIPWMLEGIVEEVVSGFKPAEEFIFAITYAGCRR